MALVRAVTKHDESQTDGITSTTREAVMLPRYTLAHTANSMQILLVVMDVEWFGSRCPIPAILFAQSTLWGKYYTSTFADEQSADETRVKLCPHLCQIKDGDALSPWSSKWCRCYFKFTQVWIRDGSSYTLCHELVPEATDGTNTRNLLPSGNAHCILKSQIQTWTYKCEGKPEKLREGKSERLSASVETPPLCQTLNFLQIISLLFFGTIEIGI